jgi:hypothetical protein
MTIESGRSSADHRVKPGNDGKKKKRIHFREIRSSMRRSAAEIEAR